jgi:hypothetical protein
MGLLLNLSLILKLVFPISSSSSSSSPHTGSSTSKTHILQDRQVPGHKTPVPQEIVSGPSFESQKSCSPIKVSTAENSHLINHGSRVPEAVRMSSLKSNTTLNGDAPSTAPDAMSIVKKEGGDDRMAGLDHAEAHYFNRYAAFSLHVFRRY